MRFSESLTALLSKSIDYAGLFPPAALSMNDAVKNYARHLDSEDSWAMGRFVVPVMRLSEFVASVKSISSHKRIWQLTVLAGADIDHDLRLISAFNAINGATARIEAIESKAAMDDEIRFLASAVPKTFRLFVELPIAADPSELICVAGESGAWVKVRTGGVTVDAFPTSVQLARFIDACAKENVGFKATAGLHHPIRSTFSLTYEPASATGKMFGYLNVFLAAAFLRNGMDMDEAVMLLEEESPDAFAFGDSGISWRAHTIAIDALRRTREQTIASFGSCSFTEPMNEIRDLISLKHSSIH
ncbi:MAG: hypothetical protein HY961_13680 [Ignavibacteriae bacterium]|nr:hypothetical protein [Ignavibacteriota bacterium]